MRLLAPLMTIALLATSGCAATGTDMGSKRSSIRSTDVIDDETIDFRMNNGDIYRNHLPSKCSGLGFERAFSYKTSTNQLCNVDIIRVLDQTAGRLDTRGACGLGKFQQIEKIPKADAGD